MIVGQFECASGTTNVDFLLDSAPHQWNVHRHCNTFKWPHFFSASCECHWLEAIRKTLSLYRMQINGIGSVKRKYLINTWIGFGNDYYASACLTAHDFIHPFFFFTLTLVSSISLGKRRLFQYSACSVLLAEHTEIFDFLFTTNSLFHRISNLHAPFFNRLYIKL